MRFILFSSNLEEPRTQEVNKTFKIQKENDFSVMNGVRVEKRSFSGIQGKIIYLP